MATTLLERLQQRLSQAPAPVQGQQSLIQQSLAARQGRATAAPSIAASNIGEQAAVAAGNAQVQQQAAVGQQAAATIGEEVAGTASAAQIKRDQLASQQRLSTTGLATEARVKRGELRTTEELSTEQRDAQTFDKLTTLTSRSDQALRKLTTDRGITEDQLFGQFGRAQSQLELDRERSQLEQALFVTTLSNKKYLQEIAQTGELRRLGTAATFQRELQDTIYGKELAGLLYSIGTMEQVDSQGRGWDEALSKLDQESRWQVYARAAANAKKRLMWYGVSSSAAKVGESWYDSSESSKSKEQ